MLLILTVSLELPLFNVSFQHCFCQRIPNKFNSITTIMANIEAINVDAMNKI
jgi:hypothetical protein